MKIGIITFHRADNYGALLQVYALQKNLMDLGHNVEIIDYRCDAIENIYVYKIIPKLRKNIFKWLFSLLVVNPQKIMKRDRCNEFRNAYLKLSDSVKTTDDRKQIQYLYDIIITGSDQIWSDKLTKGKDDWYCFKQEGYSKAKIISYGASVGNLERFKNCFKQYYFDLKKYCSISVREQEVADFLSEELNQKVYKVFDPTLLLSNFYWDDLVKKSSLNVKQEYVLYYDAEFNSVSMEIAKKISSVFEIKLVHFCKLIKMVLRGQLVEQAGPCEFLSLIKNAKYVVTSSFHATVFSVIFEKQFVTVPHPSTGSRVRDLLNSIGLNSRMVESFEHFSVDMIDDTINYVDVKKLIEERVDQSVGWIKSVLQ